MQKTRLLLTFTMCIAAIMMLVGCNILDELIKDGGGNAPLGNIFNKKMDKDSDNGAIPVITNSPQGEHHIKLYFSDQDGKRLIEVNRTIPKTLSLARETVSQWLIGPQGGTDAYPTVNPETTLRDINIKNGVATIDVSKEFLEPYSNVAPETALYGLVNTVTQFSTVQLVKIRVEGKEIKTFRSIGLTDLRFRNDLIGYSSHVSPEQPQAKDENKVLEEKKESPSSLNIFVQ